MLLDGKRFRGYTRYDGYPDESGALRNPETYRHLLEPLSAIDILEMSQISSFALIMPGHEGYERTCLVCGDKHTR